MLHEALGIVGFLLLIVGSGSMDNPSMATPAVMVLMGLLLLYISALKAGCFEQK